MSSVVLYCLAGLHVLFRLLYFFLVGGELRRRTDMEKDQTLFSDWKQFKERASFILTLDAELFIGAAIAGSCWGDVGACPPFSWGGPPWVWVGTGVVLILVGGYVKWDAYRIIGEKGWYWYNFFCPPEQTEYEEEGVYRIFDNPMYGVGYFPLFGVALLLLSPWGLVLAAFDWGMIWAFYYFCERPHTVEVLEEAHCEAPDSR